LKTLSGMTYLHHKALCSRLLALGDQVPWKALEKAVETLEYGGKVYADNPLKWRLQGAQTHLDHALGHLQNHYAGDTTEAHLAHMITRHLMLGEKMIEGERLGETQVQGEAA
jgi:hypothetical protein